MRLVKLTALASCIGFGTDVFDAGASAMMDVEDVLPTRASADDLGEALSAPAIPPVPTGADAAPGVANETEPHEAEEARLVANDRAAIGQFVPRECVHEVSADRPALTHNEQQRTQRVIAHVARRLRASDEFSRLLHMVAMRESSMQQGLVHRLSPDLQGSYSAWRKMQDTYRGNPHADDPEKWQTYGLFGMNSNYFTLLWDKAADPRVLCDAVVDVLVYRRAAIRMLKKAGGNIVCKDEHGRPYDYTTQATWETVHRAVSGGKLCPGKHEATGSLKQDFRHRARRGGIDPDRTVTLKMLGVEPGKGVDGQPWATQEAMVMGLWSEIDAAEAAAAAKLAAKTDAVDQNGHADPVDSAGTLGSVGLVEPAGALGSAGANGPDRIGPEPAPGSTGPVVASRAGAP
jgi:hypothetical protein